MPFPSQIWSKTIKYFRWGRGCWCTGRDCPCYMSYIRGVVMIRKQKLHCVISIYNYSLNCDHIVTNSPRVFPKPRKGAEFAPVNSYEPFSQPSLRSSRFLSFFSWCGDFATPCFPVSLSFASVWKRTRKRLLRRLLPTVHWTQLLLCFASVYSPHDNSLKGLNSQ